MEQTAEYFRIAWKTRQVYQPDKYCLRMDRKHVWLQKIAIWVLRKLDCNSWIMEDQLVRTEMINLRDLAKQIVEQQADLLSWYHYCGETLLVGPKEFSELEKLPFTHPLSLDLQYMWSERDRGVAGGYRTKAYGLKIVVIPHMRGALVLPKDWNK